MNKIYQITFELNNRENFQILDQEILLNLLPKIIKNIIDNIYPLVNWGNLVVVQQQKRSY